MRIPRVYTPQKLVAGDLIQLENSASHYLTRVLRMQAGRELVLFNGAGGEFSAMIETPDKNHTAVRIGEYTGDNRSSPLQIDLAIGISRGERMDWALQKATELGVTRILPLFSSRTEVKLSGPRLEKKLAHWRQVLISASEQCQRNILPELAPPQNIEVFLSATTAADLKLVLHHRAEHSLATMDKAMQQAPAAVLLLIGPEGGLAAAEIESALQNGFQALKLGPRVLRTETAPLVALTAVQQLWGDLNNIN